MEIHFTFSDLLERAMDETEKRRKEAIEFDMLCSDKNNLAI